MLVKCGKLPSHLQTDCRSSIIAVYGALLISDGQRHGFMENYKTTNLIPDKEEKMRWVGHTPRKPTGSLEKAALDWNPQWARRRGRPKKRAVEEEAMEVGKTE
jgi:hypothetical protein